MSKKNINKIFNYFNNVNDEVSKQRLKYGLYGSIYNHNSYLNWIKAKKQQLESSKNNTDTKIKKVATTIGDNPIYALYIAKGKKNILLWARMHGDETTATKSLIDIFETLTLKTGGNNSIINELYNEYTFVLIPVLNPDGMIAMDRYTYEGIDMNRDAIAFQTEGARLLHELEKEYKPIVCFNLHDQRPYYAAGNNNEATRMAFLAPPIDDKDTYNKNRLLAAKLITSILPMVSAKYPNKIARWDSGFEPRAFGEYMQQQGSATILIESGYNYNGKEREKMVKMNYSSILTMLYVLNANLLPLEIDKYKELPLNIELFFDFIARGIKIGDKEVDIALNFEHKNAKHIPFSVIVEEIGDLSTYYGHLEFKKIVWDKEFRNEKEKYKYLARGNILIINHLDIDNNCLTLK